MFRRKFLLPDLLIATNNGHELPLDQLLADFNILLVRRVPVASHGPATPLLRRLLASNRNTTDKTVRGFDIRSADQPCDSCSQPRIVFHENNLTTVCDSNCDVHRRLDLGEDHRFFVIAPDRSVIDVGSIRDIDRMGSKLDLVEVPGGRVMTMVQPKPALANARHTKSNGRTLSRDASK